MPLEPLHPLLLKRRISPMGCHRLLIGLSVNRSRQSLAAKEESKKELLITSFVNQVYTYSEFSKTTLTMKHISVY